MVSSGIVPTIGLTFRLRSSTPLPNIEDGESPSALPSSHVRAQAMTPPIRARSARTIGTDRTVETAWWTDRRLFRTNRIQPLAARHSPPPDIRSRICNKTSQPSSTAPLRPSIPPLRNCSRAAWQCSCLPRTLQNLTCTSTIRAILHDAVLVGDSCRLGMAAVKSITGSADTSVGELHMFRRLRALVTVPRPVAMA